MIRPAGALGRIAHPKVRPATGEATSLLEIGLLLLVAAVLPLTGLLGGVELQLALNIAMYSALALGLNMVVGYAGLLNLGYIAFFGMGAYLYAILASPQFGLHWPVFGVVLLSAIVAGGFGILFALPTLRLRGDYLAVVTLGFGEIVQLIANNAKGLTNGPEGIAGIDRANLLGVVLKSTTEYYYLMLVMAGLVAVLTLRIGRSRIGRSWAAIRENEDAARACGINTVGMKLLAFCLSAAVAGAVGPIFAASQAYFGPVQITLDASVLVLTMVILGGTASIRGCILGAALLVIVPEMLREYAAARFVVVGAAMVLIMILRPQGIIPPNSRPLESLRNVVARRRRARSHA